jgi:hypothetical protein
MLIRLTLILLLSFLFNEGFTQDGGSKKIIITFSDSSNLYEKIKIAFAKNDFIIREEGRVDTLTTHLREMKSMPGYCSLIAAINGNTVILSGFYGLKKMNLIGFAKLPKDFKPIIYFSGSKTWRLMMTVAQNIGSDISYSK